MTIFSLPYLNFQIEEKAGTAICCEKEKKTYRKQKSRAPSNCILYHALASDVIGKYRFDLVYLDLCGSLSKELFLCLKRCQLKRGGHLIITLLKAREPAGITHLLKRNGRIFGYRDILRKHGFHLYKTVEYRDTSPMIVLFASLRKVKKIDRFEIQ